MSSTHSRRRSLAALLAVLLTFVGIAAGCGSDGGSGDRDDGVAARAGDLGHVHDLVRVDGGPLLIAAHSGLYRLEGPERAVRVGEQHDLMAVAADADSLIASGHPNLLMERYRVEGRPPFFGLVRSTDGGESWETEGLLGDADFHALVSTPAGIFGAEASGRVWHLDPATGEWAQLGAVEARDLAIDPGESDRQLATGYDATVWVSTDGSRTWGPVADAPPLIEVEWVAAQRIVGATAAGSIWIAAEPAGPWTEAPGSAAGDVETLYVDPDGGWWVAAHGGVIVHSADDGATWDRAYTPPEDP